MLFDLLTTFTAKTADFKMILKLKMPLMLLFTNGKDLGSCQNVEIGVYRTLY